MSRFLFAVSLVALLACGTGESTSGTAGNAGDTPPVSAAAPSDRDANVAETEIVETEQIEIEADSGAADSGVANSCLSLVQSGAFAEALPLCLEAASIDPENAEVQAALAEAQMKAAAGAATDAAAGKVNEAADSATGAAADALGGIGN